MEAPATLDGGDPTVVDEETLIVHPPYVDAKLLEAHPDEPQRANVVRIGDILLTDASAPSTLAMPADHAANVVPVHVDEFAKAEGAISCKGVIFEA